MTTTMSTTMMMIMIMMTTMMMMKMTVTMTMTVQMPNDSLRMLVIGLVVIGVIVWLRAYKDNNSNSKSKSTAEAIQQDDAPNGAAAGATAVGTAPFEEVAVGAIQEDGEGGDSIEVHQQQQQQAEDEAHHQDQIEDEARHNEGLLEGMLNQEEETNEGGEAGVEVAAVNGGAIMVQQQYRVLYNPIRRHMWTIFRNPNAGMISLYQLIRNLYNMAMWVSNPLQLQVQQASAGNNEDKEDEDEDEEYNAGYFERVSSKLTYDKVCTCYRACADTFPPINDALHAHFDLLRQTNLNVNELKCKFYVSIAEALEECPKYVKWMVPFHPPSIAPINEEGTRQAGPLEAAEEKEGDNAFSNVGISQDAVTRLVPSAPAEAKEKKEDGKIDENDFPTNTYDNDHEDDVQNQIENEMPVEQEAQKSFFDNAQGLHQDNFVEGVPPPAAATSTIERIESMLSDVKGMSTVIEMTLNWPKIGNSSRHPKTVEQSVCENYLLNDSDLTNPQYSVITELIDHIKLIREKSAKDDAVTSVNRSRKSLRKGIPTKVATTKKSAKDAIITSVNRSHKGLRKGISTIPTGETLAKKVATKKTPTSKKRKPYNTTRSRGDWYRACKLYNTLKKNPKYTHMLQKDFLASPLSGPKFAGDTKGETNSFSTHLGDYLSGDFKNPHGADIGITAAKVVRRRRRKRKGTDSVNPQPQKKKPYISKNDYDSDDGDAEYLPSKDSKNDDDDGEWRHNGFY